jgi:hypothetical protein
MMTDECERIWKEIALKMCCAVTVFHPDSPCRILLVQVAVKMLPIIRQEVEQISSYEQSVRRNRYNVFTSHKQSYD